LEHQKEILEMKSRIVQIKKEKKGPNSHFKNVEVELKKEHYEHEFVKIENFNLQV
jgi:hypothetical protein